MVVEINIGDLIREVETWESKAIWPPNKTKFRRALAALGVSDIEAEPMTYLDAFEIRDSKKIDGRDYPRWDKIGLALMQLHDKTINRPKHKADGSMARPDYNDNMDVYSKLQTDIEQPVLSKRAISAYERENKNLRNTISQKNREIKNLMALGKSHKCGNCIETQQKAQETAHIQANALHDKDIKINMLQKKVNDLVNSFQTQKMSNSLDKITADKYKKLSTRLALALKQAEQAAARNIKLETKLSELTAKLELGGNSEELESLTKENNTLHRLVHEAQNKLADNTITYQDAITGLMQGRVLPPENNVEIQLTEKDKQDIKRFSGIWENALNDLPNGQYAYVYGMKNNESDIVKRHNIKIDDYGQPETNTLVEFDFARTLSYLDNAISHAHQEIQAAIYMADKLIGRK